MKLEMSRTKKPVSNYKNKNRIKKTKKEFHQTQDFCRIQKGKVGSKSEGPKNVLAAPFFESFFSAASCKKGFKKGCS